MREDFLELITDRYLHLGLKGINLLFFLMLDKIFTMP